MAETERTQDVEGLLDALKRTSALLHRIGYAVTADEVDAAGDELRALRSERDEAVKLAESWNTYPPTMEETTRTELNLFAMYLYATGQREKREEAMAALRWYRQEHGRRNSAPCYKAIAGPDYRCDGCRDADALLASEPGHEGGDDVG